jgi:undecaprenyl-diphosphatase
LPLVSDKNYLNWQQKLITSPWFKGFWVFWGIYIVAFYIFSAVLLLFPKYRMWAILAFIAFVLAKFVISGAISFFFKRVRPYQKLSFTPPTFPFLFSQLHKKSNSMPSTHAASLMAISVVCLIFLPILGILGLISTLINGIARVVLGYHYPSDVLVGWLVGLVTALASLYWLWPLFTLR